MAIGEGGLMEIRERAERAMKGVRIEGQVNADRLRLQIEVELLKMARDADQAAMDRIIGAYMGEGV